MNRIEAAAPILAYPCATASRAAECSRSLENARALEKSRFPLFSQPALATAGSVALEALPGLGERRGGERRLEPDDGSRTAERGGRPSRRPGR